MTTTTVAVHRRSGVRHLIADDGLATRCGRLIASRRSSWRIAGDGDAPDCRACLPVARVPIPVAPNRANALGGRDRASDTPEPAARFGEARR